MNAPELRDEKAERALIGSVLLDQGAYRRVRHVPPDALTDWRRRAVWEAVGDLDDEGHPPDYVLLCDRLEKEGVLGDIGGSAYLAGLSQAVPSALRVDHYAGVVLDYHRRREDVKLAEALASLAMNGGGAPADRAEIAHRILEGGGGREPTGARDAAHAVFSEIEHNVAHPLEDGEVRDLETGLIDLDRITGGLHQGLWAFAGSTSTGKTALALTIAINVALRGRRVAFVSPEMTPEDLMHRVVCAYARLDSRAIERGTLSADELEKAYDVLDWASELDLMIYEEPDAAAIEATVHRLAPLDLIVIDGVELVRGLEAEKMHVQRGEASRWAKAIADHPDVRCPVLLNMQVAVKELKGRADRRPKMGDIYGSSEPEFITDNLIYLHRADVWEDDVRKHTNMLDLTYWKCRKRRRTLPATVQFLLDPYGRVRDLSPEREPAPLGIEDEGSRWMD